MKRFAIIKLGYKVAGQGKDCVWLVYGFWKRKTSNSLKKINSKIIFYLTFIILPMPLLTKVLHLFCVSSETVYMFYIYSIIVMDQDTFSFRFIASFLVGARSSLLYMGFSSCCKQRLFTVVVSSCCRAHVFRCQAH